MYINKLYIIIIRVKKYVKIFKIFKFGVLKMLVFNIYLHVSFEGGPL